MQSTSLGIRMLAFAALSTYFLRAAPAPNACSLLTAADIDLVMKVKPSQKIPSVSRTETGCTYTVGREKIILAYYNGVKGEPKATSIKDDPFMKGLPPGPNLRDYGNTGCKITDAGVMFITNCNHYQPRWLHIAVQTHAPAPIPIDIVKALLDKAAARFH